LEENTKEQSGEHLIVEVSPTSINAAVGYQSLNKKSLQQKFKSVSFKINNNLRGNFAFKVIIK
jgi:hypothetical protein